MSRLPYLRYDDLGPDGRRVWDDVVGSRGGELITPEGGLAGPFNAFVHAPVTGQQLSQQAHDDAEAVLRPAGLVELVALCGYYTLISYLLNAFAVPIPSGAAAMWGGAAPGGDR